MRSIHLSSIRAPIYPELSLSGPYPLDLTSNHFSRKNIQVVVKPGLNCLFKKAGCLDVRNRNMSKNLRTLVGAQGNSNVSLRSEGRGKKGPNTYCCDTRRILPYKPGRGRAVFQ